MNTEQLENNPKQNFLQLLITLVIPTLILVKGGGLFNIEPIRVFLLALFFPLFYGIYDLLVEKRTSMMAVIGVINIILTGGIGLLELDPQWLAVKEAGIPFLVGSGILIAIWLKKTSVASFVLLRVKYGKDRTGT